MKVYIRLFHSAELCLNVTRILQCCCGVEQERKYRVRRNTRCISLDWFKDMIEEAGICTVVIYRLVNVSKGREKLIQSCTDTLPTELLHTQI